MKFSLALLAILASTIACDNISGRQVDVFAPNNLKEGAYLLISCHGMNQDINYQKGMAKYESIASREGFVVAYPAGDNKSWDISGDKDINFILAIIEAMVSKYKIDPKKVIMSGFSMGGMLTYLSAQKIADKIACFAPVSGYLFGQANTQSKRPIPLIHTHGTTDSVLNYNAVMGIVEAWAKRDGCEASPEILNNYANSDASFYHWKKCEDGVEVAHLKLPGKDHEHSLDKVNTSEEIWKFCSKFTTP